MIELAFNVYLLPKDDRINDTISEIFTIWGSLGEITGPLAGSLLTQYLSYEDSYSIVGTLYFVYCVYYFFMAVANKNSENKKCLETPLLTRIAN